MAMALRRGWRGKDFEEKLFWFFMGSEILKIFHPSALRAAFAAIPTATLPWT